MSETVCTIYVPLGNPAPPPHRSLPGPEAPEAGPLPAPVGRHCVRDARAVLQCGRRLLRWRRRRKHLRRAVNTVYRICIADTIHLFQQMLIESPSF